LHAFFGGEKLVMSTYLVTVVRTVEISGAANMEEAQKLAKDTLYWSVTYPPEPPNHVIVTFKDLPTYNVRRSE
jgi:hypothetical protein